MEKIQQRLKILALSPPKKVRKTTHLNKPNEETTTLDH